MAVIHITEDDIPRCLQPFERLFSQLERAFGDFSRGSAGGVVQPVRSAIAVEEHNGVFMSMSAYIRADAALGVKLVTAYPDNSAARLPTHHAYILLFEPSTGVMKAIIDGERITAERTALASAVATWRLARRGSRVLALLGTGTQAHSHFAALTRIYTFTEVRVWGRTAQSAVAFATEHKCVACDTVEEAVKDADIICTLTFSSTPILDAAWVRQGAHVNAVGAVRPEWQEITSPLMQGATVYVDSREACLKESGDIIISKCEIYAEIGEVINGMKEARFRETTVFKSVGIALEDVVSAKLVYDNYVSSRYT